MGKITAKTIFVLIIAFGGLGPGHAVLGGSLDRCDLARIAAHNAVLDEYAPLLSDLAAKSSAAKDAANATSLLTLADELKHREATDIGRADREAARDCSDSSQPVEHVAEMARSFAALGIHTVMSRHGMSASSPTCAEGGNRSCSTAACRQTRRAPQG